MGDNIAQTKSNPINEPCVILALLVGFLHTMKHFQYMLLFSCMYYTLKNVESDKYEIYENWIMNVLRIFLVSYFIFIFLKRYQCDSKPVKIAFFRRICITSEWLWFNFPINITIKFNNMMLSIPKSLSMSRLLKFFKSYQ